MTKKALVFLLVILLSLLLCTGISGVQMGMSPHFDHLNPVKEMEFSYRDNKATKSKQIFCGICKTVVKKAISYIGKTVTKDEVNRQIDTICKKIKIPGCVTFVNKYKIKLVNALLSGGNELTICIKLKLCKKMYMQA
ncbi:uncharacterized protein [Pseudorasbora parva]|uniref:uncharacterized protein n=1 Tax=Pseudorasbora parva TaxID=51549 RepID=UPI00351F5772